MINRIHQRIASQSAIGSLAFSGAPDPPSYSGVYFSTPPRPKPKSAVSQEIRYLSGATYLKFALCRNNDSQKLLTVLDR